jgi:hypothetical protein
MFINNQTMKVRPALTETSDLDDDSPTFDLFMPGLDQLVAPGSILRHQTIRGRKIHLNLDWSEWTGTPGQTVYINARLDFGDRTFWINKTISTDVTELEFDLNELDNRAEEKKKGVIMWYTANETVTKVPAVTLWAYREDPAQVTDMVSNIRNLLYADFFYLKMEYDQDYIDKYLQDMQVSRSDANSQKIWMTGLGIAMIAMAPVTAGTTAIWGVDMITSVVTGKSMFDHILQGAMRFAGVDENYVGNFSMWQITSNAGLNLILQEFLAEVISFGVGRFGSFIGNKLGLGKKAVEFALNPVEHALDYMDKASRFMRMGRIGKALMLRTGKQASSEFVDFLIKGVREYIELVGEVIGEMAFDNMLRQDEGERPMFGSEMFMLTMTLSVVVGGLMGGLDKAVRDKLLDITDSSMRRSVAQTRKLLMGVALSLSLLMTVMRIPVLLANAA